ncbi:MAG: hypothetical protein KBF88_12910 [Polyangiaceae bacterium]|nr:hypothetical protein [Polyangiaceae bacterium]
MESIQEEVKPIREVPGQEEPLQEDKGHRRRRLLFALAIYALCAIVYGVVAGKHRLVAHTSFNHYAHLAQAWLSGRQDLANGAPDYAQGNDFAVFHGKTFISFPPFPAVLMLPFVKLAGSPENFQDGQFVIVWLGGIGPALLFLGLEKLRLLRRSDRSQWENAALSLLFAFGTVYFFTAVEGTVWFAAHVVGVALLAAYFFVSIGARNPLISGLILSAAWMTRPAMLFTAVFFGFEALRRNGFRDEREVPMRNSIRNVSLVPFVRLVALFSLPLLLSFVVGSATNYTRFGNWSPFAFGHEHLTVQWAERMQKWGLFHYHYLSKNLGVMLTSLPWLSPGGPPWKFQVNEHGLALWFTTPIYLWLLWPKRVNRTTVALTVTACLPMALDLLYQNSGWRQFGYRFSNDYSVFLFALLALGNRSLRSSLFHAAAAWAIAWNLFGAITFDKQAFDRFYFREGSQTVLFQPDDAR